MIRTAGTHTGLAWPGSLDGILHQSYTGAAYAALSYKKAVSQKPSQEMTS
jgi:hypothetical protein